MKHSDRGPHFRWERDIERYLIEHPELLGLLIFGWQVKAGVMRRIDLLGMDASGDIYVIEVKRKSTTDRVIAQVLDYVHWGRTLTREQIVSVAARRRLLVDLPTAFERRFGHPLPMALNSTLRVIIVAAGLDLRTSRAIEVLNDGRHPVVAFQYRVTGRSITLEEIKHGAAETQGSGVASESALYATATQIGEPERSAASGIGEARQSTMAAIGPEQGYPVHDDVREFWAIFSILFSWPFVPFALVYARYNVWRKEEKKEGRHRSRQQSGLFGKQIAALVRESSGWAYARVPLADLVSEDGAYPHLPSLSEGYARRLVSGYRRLTAGGTTSSKCTPGLTASSHRSFCSLAKP